MDFMDGFKDGLSLKKDWKLHLLVLCVAVLVELFGAKTLSFADLTGATISFSFSAELIGFMVGIILSVKNVVSQEYKGVFGTFISLGICFLIGRLAINIGPSWGEIVKAGPALLLQEIGNLGTVLLAVPFAVLVCNMGREAVGAGFSIARESSLAIIGGRYGLDSTEGIGVLGAYVLAGVDPVIMTALISFLISLGIFHPYALAMATGIGSVPTSAAALAVVTEAYPALADACSAFGVTSQTVSGSTAIYVNLFISLPLAEFLYRNCRKMKDSWISKKVK